MARRQAADYGQRRTAIVETAAELFAQKGFLGASIADLARACGASKSLVYHYYPSKEDILFEVMDSHLAGLAAAAEAAERSKGSAAERLERLTHAFMGLYVGAASRHKVLLNELGQLPPERRALVVGRQRRLVELVEGLIVQARPDLDKPGSLRAATMLFFGMINWTHTWFRPDGPASADAVADLAAGLMLGRR